ncbi:MAG: hypothetical protein NT015_10145 [Alphaproteobacteria bacterium]|nr:hypothetical protein [Alphaproteobacteria bacterium]
MLYAPYPRFRKQDIFIEPDIPNVRWRIVDHWRDVYVLQRLDDPRRRRFVYDEEISDASRFVRAGSAAGGDGCTG